MKVKELFEILKLGDAEGMDMKADVLISMDEEGNCFKQINGLEYGEDVEYTDGVKTKIARRAYIIYPFG